MPMEVIDLRSQVEAGFSIAPGTQKADVLRVLVTNPEMAFTPKEIAARANIPSDNAPTVCRRLADMGAAINENGYYYLPQDEETAVAVQRALGSVHQQDMAQKTAAADEVALADESAATESRSLSDTEVDAAIADLDEELSDI